MIEEIKDKDGKVIAKVSSKEEAAWTRIQFAAKHAIETDEIEIKIQKEMLVLATRKLKELERKPK